jgi:hypothetical protein
MLAKFKRINEEMKKEKAKYNKKPSKITKKRKGTSVSH